MKEYEVRVTEYAERALRGIVLYIARELHAPEAAVATLNTIREGIASLREMPERIHLTPEEPWRTEGVRRMKVKHFYVYFWIDEANARVQVTHVVYTGREQKAQLNEMPLS